MELEGKAAVNGAPWATFALCLVLIWPAHVNEPIAGIASVIDGATIEIHGERIRFFDMDAPETRQLC